MALICKYSYVFVLSSVLACAPKDDQEQTESGSSEPTGTAGDSSSTGDEPTAGTTGADACALGDQKLWRPDRMASVDGDAQGSCVVSAVTEEEESLHVELQCDDLSSGFTVRPGNARPATDDWVGATFEVDIAGYIDDFSGLLHDWVILRRDGRLVFASVVGQRLVPEGADLDAFAPLAITPVYGLCEAAPSEIPLSPDGFGCEFAAFAQLSFKVGDGEPALLQDGQTASLAAEGGRYELDVRRVVQGTKCGPDLGPDPVDTYAFSAVFVAD